MVGSGLRLTGQIAGCSGLKVINLLQMPGEHQAINLRFDVKDASDLGYDLWAFLWMVCM